MRTGPACSCLQADGTSVQVLFFEIGAHSSIHTTSPTLATLASSCAWYFLERRTVFFITGWVKARSTRTTTVLSFTSETTVPCSTRLGIVFSLLRRGLLAEDRLDPRDLAADFLDPGRLFELLRGTLEAQVELLLLETEELVLQFIG